MRQKCITAAARLEIENEPRKKKAEMKLIIIFIYFLKTCRGKQ